MSCFDELDGARLVVVDHERQLALAWFGGTGVNIYNEAGEEVDYFTLGPGNLTPEVVKASMLESIASWDDDDDDSD